MKTKKLAVAMIVVGFTLSANVSATGSSKLKPIKPDAQVSWVEQVVNIISL